jgi:hypothetical protein
MNNCAVRRGVRREDSPLTDVLDHSAMFVNIELKGQEIAAM